MSRRLPRATGAMALAALALLAPLALPAQDTISVSGLSEASASGALGYDYGSGPVPSLGAEAYAGLRLRARAAEGATFHAAFNLLAASGSVLPPSLLMGAQAGDYVVGEGYAAALELERLYLKLEAEAVDAELGLLRLPFGYGQAWSPLDFLSKRNPLHPRARARGVLGFSLSAYPTDELRLRLFGAAGPDPLERSGEGARIGLSGEAHGALASVQALYAFEAPDSGHSLGLHRAGLSIKVDAAASLVLDALYTLDPATLGADLWYGKPRTGLEGLEASLGVDASFADGKLIGVAQYLYHGSGYLEAGESLDLLYGGDAWSSMPPEARVPDPSLPLGELNRRHYLFASLSWLATDYTNATLTCVVSLADLSALTTLGFEHELSQALSLGIDAGFGLDGRVFSSSLAYGEFGPAHSGSLASLSSRLRLKF